MTALGEDWVVQNKGDMGVDLGIHTRKKDWVLLKHFMEEGFRLKSRDEWATLFYGEQSQCLFGVTAGLTLFSHRTASGTDACVVPVLTPEEAAVLASRSSTSSASVTPTPAPNPAPFLSRTPASADTSNSYLNLLKAGEHTYEVLSELGLQESEVMALVKEGVVGGASADGRVEEKAKL